MRRLKEPRHWRDPMPPGQSLGMRGIRGQMDVAHGESKAEWDTGSPIPRPNLAQKQPGKYPMNGQA